MNSGFVGELFDPSEFRLLKLNNLLPPGFEALLLEDILTADSQLLVDGIQTAYLPV